MHKLNFTIYYNVVVEKIKDKKGKFWCNFAVVGKLMSTYCIVLRIRAISSTSITIFFHFLSLRLCFLLISKVSKKDILALLCLTRLKIH